MKYKIILKTTDNRKHTFYDVTAIDNDGRILSIEYIVKGKVWVRNYNWNSIIYYNVTEAVENESGCES